MSHQVTDAYAQAFLSLAIEENKVEFLRDQAEEVVKTLDSDILRFFRISSIDKQSKRAVIKDCMKKADTNLQNLLCLLVDSNRSFYMAEVLKRFIVLANKELNIQEITIESASELSEQELNEICSAVEKNLNKKVIASVKIDKSLLAGTRIFINDRVYDTSLKTRIAHLREELLRESW